MAIRDITSDTSEYTIVSGDTLIGIAQRCITVGMSGFSGLTAVNENSSGVRRLMTLNPDIVNANFIYIGQKIKLKGTASTKTKAVAQRAKITAFGRQTGNYNRFYATWAWDKPSGQTKNFIARWRYGTGDGIAWPAGDQTIDPNLRVSTFDLPDNATRVLFNVMPVSNTYGSKNVKYFNSQWSTEVNQYITDDFPKTPVIADFAHETTSGCPIISEIEEDRKVTIELRIPETDGKYVAKSDTAPMTYLNAHEMQIDVLNMDGTIYKSGRSAITRTKVSKIKLINSNTGKPYTSNDAAWVGFTPGTYYGTVSFSCVLIPGRDYKFRCRTYKGEIKSKTVYDKKNGQYSDWFEWPEAYTNIDEHPIIPFRVSLSDVEDIRSITVNKTIVNDQPKYTVRITWPAIASVDKYIVGYSTSESAFDPNNFGSITENTIENGGTYAEIPDLVPGTTYYFAVKTDDSSALWSRIKSVTIGSQPSSPTTWSLTSTVKVGENGVFYWIHNATDDSVETFADLDLSINGTHVILNGSREYVEANAEEYITVVRNESIEPGTQTNSSYTLLTNSAIFVNGAEIKWRVRTYGVSDDQPGVWSEYRTLYVYAEPIVSLLASMPIVINNETHDIELSENSEENQNGLITKTPLLHFPINIQAEVTTNSPDAENNTPLAQTPIGYYITIESEESYNTTDSIGNEKKINNGEVILNKYYDTELTELSFNDDEYPVFLNANDVDLENNCTYKLTCSVVMTSGLRGSASQTFKVAWVDEENWPDMQIGYDQNTYTTLIKPYCVDNNGILIPDTMLSVYRREFDGSYTEIAKDLDNESETFIVDPHPSLDYARYRVISKSGSTGAINYYDPPGLDIGETAVILQWDETRTDFKYTDEAQQDSPAWSGELLRLPYNIDISDSHAPEATMVSYIGRSHPVCYYGTQVGHNATWSMEIPKNDTDSLYQLRKLARWLGNVYVREPSGSGYLANVQVSFSQTHMELTIPVSLSITRVEGE